MVWEREWKSRRLKVLLRQKNKKIKQWHINLKQIKKKKWNRFPPNQWTKPLALSLSLPGARQRKHTLTESSLLVYKSSFYHLIPISLFLSFSNKISLSRFLSSHYISKESSMNSELHWSNWSSSIFTHILVRLPLSLQFICLCLWISET